MNFVEEVKVLNWKVRRRVSQSSSSIDVVQHEEHRYGRTSWIQGSLRKKWDLGRLTLWDIL